MWERFLAGLAYFDLHADRALLRLFARLLFQPLSANRGLSEADYSETHNSEVCYSQTRNATPHIVIYRVGNIGDTVAAMPAMAAVRERFPKARITLLTSAGNADLPSAVEVLAPFPDLVQRIVTYTPQAVKRWPGLRQLRADVLSADPVDLFITLPVTLQTFQRAMQELFLARFLGSKSAIGFELLLPEIFRSAYSRRFPQAIPKTADWLLSLVSELASSEGENASASAPVSGIQTALAQCWQTSVHRLVEQAWKPFCERTGLSVDAPILLVNAGAKLAIKQWPLDYFRTTLHVLRKRLPTLQIVLLGNASEATRNEQILAGLEGPNFNLAGQLSLQETWMLMHQASAVLSNDTGPMHMAGLLDKLVFTPMSGQFPAPLWHPHSENNQIQMFRHPVACAPCFRDQCPLSEQVCLTQLKSERLTEALMSHFAALADASET